MFTIRSVRNGAAVILLGAASLVALSPQSAQAAVDGRNCTWTNNIPLERITANCWNPTQSSWYLELTCQRRGNNKITYARGLTVTGSGSSTATCDASVSEIIDVNLVNL